MPSQEDALACFSIETAQLCAKTTEAVSQNASLSFKLFWMVFVKDKKSDNSLGKCSATELEL